MNMRELFSLLLQNSPDIIASLILEERFQELARQRGLPQESIDKIRALDDEGIRALLGDEDFLRGMESQFKSMGFEEPAPPSEGTTPRMDADAIAPMGSVKPSSLGMFTPRSGAPTEKPEDTLWMAFYQPA